MAIQIISTRSALPVGLPMTKESAEKVYCGLGKNWWKQLYDGKYHAFGPEVFDKGLHGNGAEPGFYESAFKAFEFAKQHLNEKLSVEFYRNLHKEACTHFKGAENKTEIKAHDTGRFRATSDKDVGCTIKLHLMLKVFDRKNDRERVIRDYCILKNSYGDEIVKICADGTTLKDKDTWAREFIITPSDAQEIETLIQNKIKAAQETLDEWANDSVMKDAIPKITLGDDALRIQYRKPLLNGFDFEEVVSHLFEAFNRSLSEVDKELVNTPPNEQEKIDRLVDKKLVLIDDLYQKLEWLHPYPDGQGRTDLLLFAKLLSENGFNPAIWDEPYMSSFSSREDCLAYLKEGMQKWEEERKKALGAFLPEFIS